MRRACDAAFARTNPKASAFTARSHAPSWLLFGSQVSSSLLLWFAFSFCASWSYHRTDHILIYDWCLFRKSCRQEQSPSRLATAQNRFLRPAIALLAVRARTLSTNLHTKLQSCKALGCKIATTICEMACGSRQRCLAGNGVCGVHKERWSHPCGLHPAQSDRPRVSLRITCGRGPGLQNGFRCT